MSYRREVIAIKLTRSKRDFCVVKGYGRLSGFYKRFFYEDFEMIYT